MDLENVVDTDQDIIILINGDKIKEEILEEGREKELTIPLPEQERKRIQVEIRLPDAVQNLQSQEALGWIDYASIRILSATIE